MKYLLLLLLLFPFLTEAKPMSTIQTKTAFQSNPFTPLTFSFTSNPTSGNLIFVGVIGDSFSTPTDNLGNTYTLIDSVGWSKIYYAKNITGGALTITIVNSGFELAAVAGEYSGLNSNPFDIYKITSGLTSTTDTSSAKSSGVVIGFTYTDTSITTFVAGTGFGNLAQIGTPSAGKIAIESKDFTVKETQTATFTRSLGSGTVSTGVFVFSGPNKGIRLRLPVSGGVKLRLPVSGGLKIRK